MPLASRRSPGEVHADGGRRSWRVLKSHDGHRCFARALSSGQALAVYAYRDIRDVVFSLMHKRGLAFEELLRQGMIHEILINDRFWRRNPGCSSTLRRACRGSGDCRGPTRPPSRARGHPPGGGRDRRRFLAGIESDADSTLEAAGEAGIDLTAPGNLQICNPVRLLHSNHLRPGGTGSWQTDLRFSHRVLLDRLCGAWLRAKGYASELEAAALAEQAGYASGVGLHDDLTLAVGQLAFWLRRVAGHCPRTAKRVKQFLGMADSDPELAGGFAGSEPVPSFGFSRGAPR